MLAELGVWLVKHLVVPVLIYMIVSSWSISHGVDSYTANIIGAACAFGTFIVTFKFEK